MSTRTCFNHETNACDDDLTLHSPPSFGLQFDILYKTGGHCCTLDHDTFSCLAKFPHATLHLACTYRIQSCNMQQHVHAMEHYGA